MAKKNRCTVCGYKFKKDDSNICPECLTSREDTMSCDDISADLHSHSSGYGDYAEEKSDAQKQLERERRESVLAKNSDEPKFTSKPYTDPKLSSRLTETQRKKLDAYYSGNRTSGNGSVPPINTSVPPYSTNRTPDFSTVNKPKKNPSRLAVGIIIAIIAINFVPAFLSGIISVFANQKSEKSDGYTYNSEIDVSSITVPEVPDFNIDCAFGDTINNITSDVTVDLPKIIYADPADEYPDFIDHIKNTEGYSENWYLISVPISVENKMAYENRTIITCTVTSNGNDDLGYSDMVSECVNENYVVVESQSTGGHELVFVVPEAESYVFTMNVAANKYNFEFACNDYDYADRMILDNSPDSDIPTA